VTTAAPLLVIEHLRTHFHTEAGVVKAVDDLSIAIGAGETVGLVGESGSGKSVASLSLMQLLPERGSTTTGNVVFLQRSMLALSARQMTSVRGADMAMIFQEPMTSLNPVFRVGDQVAETILTHQPVSRREAMERTLQLFREVGIPDPERRIHSYPHEMSGGQKQRVMIAMALACNPKLLICDEPTTALDVTIQAQILDLLRSLRDQRGMAMLFITHDFGVIAEIADRVAVMYRGKLVEYGDVLDVFERPQHPYTKGLLACKPRLDTIFETLPTVDDYMLTEVRDGEIVITERPMTAARLESFVGVRKRNTEPTGEPLLEVHHLSVVFGGSAGAVRAVDDVSFSVWPGQTLGLVGESGCGKTTTGRAIIGLVPKSAGTLKFQGTDLTRAFAEDARMRSREDLRLVAILLVEVLIAIPLAYAGMSVLPGLAAPILALLVLVGVVVFTATTWTRLATGRRSLRADLQIVFQDPYSSLNPRMSVEEILTEPMLVHGIGKDAAERRDRAAALLAEVGLLPEHLRRYPHEFSGGQRQRICIARALSVEPKLLICDEAVSALDVSVQAQVLNLLRKLQKDRGLTYIFISHDLSVVKFMSDTMAVMQGGRIVEAGNSEAIYDAPQQEYTRRLIDAIPKDDVAHIRAIRAQRTPHVAHG
jgi:peptide/nickel transport system ATP-binding protein